MTCALLMHDELARPGAKDALWRVLSPHTLYGRVKLFNRSTGQEEWKELADIDDEIANDKLVIRRQGSPAVSLPKQPAPELEVALAKARAALGAIKAKQVKQSLSFHQAYEDARSSPEVAQQGWFPSRATAYRYAKRQRNGLPVLRGDANKGNRKARYPEEVVKLIVDYANGLFLQESSSWTLRTLCAAINLASRAAGLIPKTATISRAFVSKTIFENLSADPELARMDPRLAKSAKAIAANRIRVTFPFERVEQDALHLPFVVNTPHGPTSNVWLVHAIDCGTGMPLGQHLGIGSPASINGLLCVENVFFSKRAQFQRLGIDTDLDPHGTPHLYVFDNGPEAKNERMHKLVRLGIDVTHCRSHEGNGKPFIERLNLSLKRALEVLGGCTRKDGKDGARDPIALGDELMTLDELRVWIVRWLYEHWANQVLKRHLRTQFADIERCGATPAERWRRMTGELAFALPISPSRADWRRVLYEHHDRTLNRKTGISFDGFNYKGPNLPSLIEALGERSVEVLVDPEDFRQVFVEVGGESAPEALTEEFVDETTPAHSFERAKELFKRPAQEPDGPAAQTREKFERDVIAAGAKAQAARSAKGKKSKAEQNRQVKQKSDDAHAVKRAVDRPLPPQNAASESTRTHHPTINFDEVPALPVLSRRDGEIRS